MTNQTPHKTGTAHNHVVVLVNTTALSYSLLRRGEHRCDYGVFRRYIRTWAEAEGFAHSASEWTFAAEVDENRANVQPFITALRATGWRVNERVEVPSDCAVVIVDGAQTSLPLMRELQRVGKRTIAVAYFDRETCRSLQEQADAYLALNERVFAISIKHSRRRSLPITEEINP